MILKIINFRQIAKKCVTKRTHFFILFFSLVFMLYAVDSSAHRIVLSAYKLKYENDSWVLYFQQKTGALRDAVYNVKPDLKGMNLNSETFLDATKQVYC